MNTLPKFVIGAVVALVLIIILLLNSFVTIGAGEGGVLFRPFSGGVDTNNIYLEGFHVVAPWNTMYEYEVRQKELKENMQVLSSNGLDIDLEVSLWYHPNVNKLAFLHQQVGEGYVERVMQPAIRSAARSVIGRYTPEQIYSSKRDAIQKEIFEETTLILENKFIILERVLVRDVSLPPTIKDAIERKLKQEQESLEYEFRLQKAQKEAQRQEIEANGKAIANEILNASLSENILRDKGIDATNKLAESDNTKIIIIGDKDGMPLILGNQ
ncbi:prohibitin family protein [Flavobacteriaceae bacterium Ap0902]|nr:prohibitin family protein [Flavobacteriaceae bacterium Ap0902]